MKKITAVFCVLMACVAGCSMQPMSHDLMNRNDVVVSEEVPEGSARIVFLRMSSVSAGETAGIFEVQKDESQQEEVAQDKGQEDTEVLGHEFIAMLPNQSKFTVDLPPGSHRFMAISQGKKLHSAEYVQAELEAGKTYYVVVKPEPAYGKTVFRLHPVHASPVAEYQINSESVRYMIESSRNVDNTGESTAWANRYEGDIADLIERTRGQWDKLSQQQRNYFTLQSSDGI